MRLLTKPVHAKPVHGLVSKPGRHLHCSATEFWRARQAVAAVEFALMLPFLVLLMLGSVEVARLIIFSRNVTQVAATVVEMLSQNGVGTINYVDLHFAQDSAMVIFPQILQDAAQKNISWGNDISISMASVLFTPNPSTCTSNCSYTANVVWNSGPNKRVCGVPLNPVPDTAAPSNTTLPTDVFGPGSLIVVDIAINYTPMFGSTFTAIFGSPLFGTIPIKHSAYLAPRYVPLVNYAVVSGDDGIGAECPGY
jgi:Flp pilus assembly protein TadG